MRSVFTINHICVKRINLNTSEYVLLYVRLGGRTGHLTLVVLFPLAIYKRNELLQSRLHLSRALCVGKYIHISQHST